MVSAHMMRLKRCQRRFPKTNKSLSTRTQDTRRNTIAVQATHNPVVDSIYEEMDHRRIDFGLALKHGTRGAKKVNMVNYLTKPHPPIDD